MVGIITEVKPLVLSVCCQPTDANICCLPNLLTAVQSVSLRVVSLNVMGWSKAVILGHQPFLHSTNLVDSTGRDFGITPVIILSKCINIYKNITNFRIKSKFILF